MAVLWNQYAVMAPAGCLPCCVQNIPAPGQNYCQCYAYVPYTENVFSNYALANSAVTLQTNNCIAYCVPAPNALIAVQGVAALNVAANVSANYQHLWASITVAANTALNIGFTSNAVGGNANTSISAGVNVYYCNGNVFSTNTNTGSAGTAASGYFTPPVLTVAGQYYLDFYTLGFSGSTGTNSNWTASSNLNMVVDPVVALWDDSGTTRYLWACPKLFLPPIIQGPGFGSWYANCAEANSVISSRVSNCVGYSPVDPASFSAFSFSATDGGTYLNENMSVQTNVELAQAQGGMMGCVNANVGATISANYAYVASGTSASTADGEVSMTLIDYDGATVETVTVSAISTDSNTGTLTSSALPYSGHYLLVFGFIGRYINADPGDTSTVSTNVHITSSAALSVNPVQALYDISLLCPARLSCGDTCP